MFNLSSLLFPPREALLCWLCPNQFQPKGTCPLPIWEGHVAPGLSWAPHHHRRSFLINSLISFAAIRSTTQVFGLFEAMSSCSGSPGVWMLSSRTVCVLVSWRAVCQEDRKHERIFFLSFHIVFKSLLNRTLNMTIQKKTYFVVYI